jgi:Mn2+/Fe2+ NRAMP family transporter
MATSPDGGSRRPWWLSIGPALITACVVFGPGSLLISSNVGARYGYDLLWLLVLNGLFMGTYVVMGARIGVIGGATPVTLLARRLGRPAAAVVGLNLCLICSAFQFSNNLALAMAAEAIAGKAAAPAAMILLNGIIITFLFTALNVYRAVERIMKVMVALILLCFLSNLVLAAPPLAEVVQGLVPDLPADFSLRLPRAIRGPDQDALLLMAALLGTTFSVAAAFYQGNLVRDKGWSIEQYRDGIKDAIAGVSVLTFVSMMIMITTATVIPGEYAGNVGALAQCLRPLLGPIAFSVFCVGLVAVSMNPFLINAMIGGSILADVAGKPARLSDYWSRVLTVVVLLLGMVVALFALRTGRPPMGLIIFGQAMIVLGNPLMAIAMLYLANSREVMGDRRNSTVLNVFGFLGLVVILLMAAAMVFRLVSVPTKGAAS